MGIIAVIVIVLLFSIMICAAMSLNKLVYISDSLREITTILNNQYNLPEELSYSDIDSMKKRIKGLEVNERLNRQKLENISRELKARDSFSRK